MEAVGVGPAVDELVDRPLVAVKGEDHGLSRREQLDERASVMPWGWCSRREQRHQVDDVDDAHPQLRHVLPQPPAAATVSRVGMSPAAARTMSGSASLVDARPLPDATRRARSARSRSSMSSHWSCGCLSMTMRLT